MQPYCKGISSCCMHGHHSLPSSADSKPALAVPNTGEMQACADAAAERVQTLEQQVDEQTREREREAAEAQAAFDTALGNAAAELQAAEAAHEAAAAEASAELAAAKVCSSGLLLPVCLLDTADHDFAEDSHSHHQEMFWKRVSCSKATLP